LPRAFTSADNKIVRKAAYLAQVQQNYIVRLLFAGGFHGFAGQFYSFQYQTPPVFFIENYTT
jgi:hypothetical protein